MKHSPDNQNCCRFCKRKDVKLRISCRNKYGSVYKECKDCGNKRMKKWVHKDGNMAKMVANNRRYLDKKNVKSK